MKTLRNYSLGFALVAGLGYSMLSAAALQENTPLYASQDEQDAAFSKIDGIDQPFAMFVTEEKPYLMNFDPSTNKIKLVFCAAQNARTKDIKKVTKPAELETITPIRLTLKNSQPKALQIDKKYPGCREAWVGIGLEKMLKFMTLIPDDKYKGTVLVDEYKAGLPLKLVVQNPEELHYLLNYLIKNLATNKQLVITLANRPLLLLECAKGINAISDTDKFLLKALFVVVNPKNEKVKEFFRSGMEKYVDSLDASKGAINIAESFGETILRMSEDNLCEFKGKDLAAYAFVSLLAIITWELVKDYRDTFKRRVVSHIPLPI
jgi:hypothetical protein